MVNISDYYRADNEDLDTHIKLIEDPRRPSIVIEKVSPDEKAFLDCENGQKPKSRGGRSLLNQVENPYPFAEIAKNVISIVVYEYP